MKVLLTGAAGFIGFHTALALLKRGDQVVGLDNFSPYYDPTLKEARAAILKEEKGFSMIRGSITDRETVHKAMRGVDRICHLAALAGVRYSFEHPEEYIENNIQGFFEVLDEARLQEIPGFVYASSSSVYGGNDHLPASEEERVDNQLSLYGMNKRDNELMAHTYHHLYGLPITGLRFFTVYGPWGRPDMALFLFTDAILKGHPLQVFGEGKMQRDFTYVDDIVAGIMASLDRNYPEEIFNLGCGRKEELMDFIETIERSCGKEAKKEYLPMQPGDVRASLADISKARKMLGYEPKTMIATGVPKFVEWYRGYYKI
ncbi:TPA: protein CapI [Candidatus Peribacteria bacterium]|nr:MAG: protein CapI [Candidatus Peribacteria bacterium RIFOXYC2_FULL_58_10]OGJ84339.1 MAG: protein CapI [Candidatus Peribacteria bacterium RIFOXYD2_FULL_58_15]HAI98152.1 protein CapI [Candidatus Peribacteria bacterium]HAS34567.1 protein CapI [Candidatus Peribacteria bacterium]